MEIVALARINVFLITENPSREAILGEDTADLAPTKITSLQWNGGVAPIFAPILSLFCTDFAPILRQKWVHRFTF